MIGIRNKLSESVPRKRSTTALVSNSTSRDWTPNSRAIRKPSLKAHSSAVRLSVTTKKRSNLFIHPPRWFRKTSLAPALPEELSIEPSKFSFIHPLREGFQRTWVGVYKIHSSWLCRMRDVSSG
ncbi:hypothetical protein CDL15_Pgr001483 [Punica granatum]|uniref:Uncharacterized protein n=1 Tax=Punica granatum TaxID=22663 RepID=A0A218WLL5_PUNGR|nr:hypothetical protein CDL15_Pgr001483 [Punica granatum]